MTKKLVIVLSVFVGLVSICISGCESPEQEVKKLIQALQHKNSQVRHAAAGALGSIGKDAVDAILSSYNYCRIRLQMFVVMQQRH